MRAGSILEPVPLGVPAGSGAGSVVWKYRDWTSANGTPVACDISCGDMLYCRIVSAICASLIPGLFCRKFVTSCAVNPVVGWATVFWSLGPKPVIGGGLDPCVLGILLDAGKPGLPAIVTGPVGPPGVANAVFMRACTCSTGTPVACDISCGETLNCCMAAAIWASDIPGLACR